MSEIFGIRTGGAFRRFWSRGLMPGVKLFTSNRLENLSEALAEVLQLPLRSPLEPEIIVVQSKGMERWVSMELARHHGILANCRFPFPNHFIYGVFRSFLGDLPDGSSYDSETMLWKVMKVLPSCLERSGFEGLRAYLQDDSSGLKLYQLSRRIAVLFDQYLTYRPDMILRWEREAAETSADARWQAFLWRRIVEEVEEKHRAALRADFLKAAGQAAFPPEGLPERVSVFGISALPPFHMEVLAVLSRFVDVNFFLLNPCLEYWGHIVSGYEIKHLADRRISGPTAPEDLYLEKGNSLLASMGSLGKDFFDLLSELDFQSIERFEDPGEETLLAAIQSDILNLRDREGFGKEKSRVMAGDDSIRIHSCHSPMREVEVLQDQLLALFESDPDLLPKDILVITPDIGSYAPFIEAVFSLPSEDPRWIPFSIADRGTRLETPLANVFLGLLDFRDSRFGASQVFRLLESEAVRRKYALSEAYVELIERWVRDTGIRWGVGPETRRKFGLPAFSGNTWRAGLDRMLLGYALSGGGDERFMDVLPYDLIEGQSADVLGRFLDFTENLFKAAEDLERSRLLEEWAVFLSGLLDTFFIPEGEVEQDFLRIRKTLVELASKQRCSGFDRPVDLAVVRAYLEQTLGTEGSGLGFLGGGVTFCAMLPMRSIPAKVICLIGMNHDAYPRQEKPPRFDLMARKPRRGDRSRRNDDRYLFLETVLSARAKLYISYIGRNIQDNSIRPPSVLVSELADAIEEGFDISSGEGNLLEEIIVNHRLQAFSAEYFRKDGKLFSYSRENHQAALAAGKRGEPGPFISGTLPEPAEAFRTVELEDFCRFFANPSKYFLNHRLGIYLDGEKPGLDENEPFEMKGIDRYEFDQYLLKKLLEGVRPDDLFSAVKARGWLPPGTPGECLYNGFLKEAEAFLLSLEPHIREERLAPLEVDLEIAGCRIRGRLDGVYAGGLVHYRYTKAKPKDRLRMWIHHLLLNRLCRENYPRLSTLVTGDCVCRYEPLEEGNRLLAVFAEAYRTGLCRPLPFFPVSAWAYASALAKGKDERTALEKAKDCFFGGDFKEGEGKETHVDLCFRRAESLGDGFKELAGRIFLPMIDSEKNI